MADEHKNGNSRIDDLTAYPILTEDISSSTGGTPTGPSTTGSSAPIGQVVQNALRNVLAWKPRTGDPKAFVSALTQAFDLTTFEGHVDWKWNQRSYAIDADLGKVTGAQASIYARAKSFLDQVMPLIQGFTPLRPDFIQDEVDAIRAVVINGVNELVNELGLEGGPRISRVTQLFRLLLGPRGGAISSHATLPLGLSPDLGGQLGLMREKFGFNRRFVNTIPDEEVQTNFLILVDGVQALLYTWTTQKRSFEGRGPDVFLGTQAVLLSRSLGVIAEAIQDAYIVMDSVFLGAAERQVLELHLGQDRFGGDSSIFLADLLSWIEGFATTEGPLLINDGGLLGVTGTFIPTVCELERLARRAAAVSRGKSNNPIKAYHQPRVTVALEAIAQQLGESRHKSTALLADHMRITDISPASSSLSSSPNAKSVTLTITGHNFHKGSTVLLEKSTSPFDAIQTITTVSQGLTDSSTTLNVTLVPETGREYGLSEWDVLVIDPRGFEDFRPRGFQINPPMIRILTHITAESLIPKAATQPNARALQDRASDAAPVAATMDLPLQVSASFDAVDDSKLLYNWEAVSSPAGLLPTFSPNGGNTANKTTATLYQAGIYTLQVTVSEPKSGQSIVSSLQVSVPSTPAGIVVTPSSVELNHDEAAHFTAIVHNHFRDALDSQAPVTWTVGTADRCHPGSIDPTSGLYTAPNSAHMGSNRTISVTVTASVAASSAAESISSSAAVTVRNTAPTLARHASAHPHPVRGTWTNLSVLGRDNEGEAKLRYKWTWTCEEGVKQGQEPSFSVNDDSPAARNVTVTFGQAGHYAFKVRITDEAGLESTDTVDVEVEQTLTSVNIEQCDPPKELVTPVVLSASTRTAKQLDLKATAVDQFGCEMTNQAITWFVRCGGGGKITESGEKATYTSPKFGRGESVVFAAAGCALSRGFAVEYRHHEKRNSRG